MKYRAHHILALLLATTPAVAHASAGPCAFLFSAAPSDSFTALGELVLLKATIDALPDGADKTMAIRDFQSKARQVAALVGPDFARLFKERSGIIGSEQARTAQEKEKKEETQRAKETQALLHLTRIRRHDEAKAPGPWLDDARMIVLTDKGLRLYDVRARQLIPDAFIESIPMKGADGWKRGELAISADKKSLVLIQRETEPLLVDLEKKTVQPLPFKIADTGTSAFRFSRSGEELFIAGNIGETIIYSLTDQKVLLNKKIGSFETNGQQIIESPDGHWVFFIRKGQDELLYDLKNREIRELPPLEGVRKHFVYDAAFSPDSSTLTLADSDQMRDLDLASNALKPSRIPVYSEKFAVSGDGTRLALIRDEVGGDDTIRAIRLFDLATGAEIPLDLSAFKIYWPTNFMLDAKGETLIFVDGKAERSWDDPKDFRIYRLDFASAQLQLFPQNAETPRLALRGTTPDGNALIGVLLQASAWMHEIH